MFSMYCEETCKSRIETIRVVKSMTKHVHNHVHYARRGQFFHIKRTTILLLSHFIISSTSIKILVSNTRRPNPNSFKIDRCVRLTLTLLSFWRYELRFY